MTTVLDYPLRSAPTISLASFTNVLRNAGSPIAAEAAGVYGAFVAHGINPAVGLAIAQHESSYGKAGIAVGRRNPYGDRFYAGIKNAVNRGGWASFSSYTAAAQYEAGLLAGPKYAGGAYANTARTFAQVYAPSSDGNNPKSYGSAIVGLINKWSGGVGAIHVTPSPAGTTHHATKPAKGTPKSSGALGARLGAYGRAHPKATAVEGGLAAAALVVLL